jgi:hypothetical protein
MKSRSIVKDFGIDVVTRAIAQAVDDVVARGARHGS